MEGNRRMLERGTHTLNGAKILEALSVAFCLLTGAEVFCLLTKGPSVFAWRAIARLGCRSLSRSRGAASGNQSWLKHLAHRNFGGVDGGCSGNFFCRRRWGSSC